MVLSLLTFFSLLLVPVASARTVNEGIPATNFTIEVDTRQARVEIGGNYTGATSSVSLYVSSNMVVGGCVVHSTGSVTCNGSVLGSGGAGIDFGPSTAAIAVSTGVLSISTTAIRSILYTVGASTKALSLSTATLSVSTEALRVALSLSTSALSQGGATTYLAVGGNAVTATALAANPTDCDSGDFVNAMDANGTLTCDTPAGGGAGHTVSSITATDGILYDFTARAKLAFEGPYMTVIDSPTADATIVRMTTASFGSGVVVQSTQTVDCLARTTAALIPLDNTIPQITEGTQWISSTFTLTNSANRVRITASAHVSNNGNYTAIALFEGATASALRATAENDVNAIDVKNLIIKHEMAGWSGSKVISANYGSNSGSSGLNRSINTILFTSVMCSSILIEEVAPTGAILLPGYAAAASSFTLLSQNASLTQTGNRTCYAGSTVTITGSGAPLDVIFSGSAKNTSVQDLAVGFLVNGKYYAGQSATLSVINTLLGNVADSMNVSFMRTVEDLAAGPVSACLTGYASGGTTILSPTSVLSDAKPHFGIREMRNAPGTGDVCTNCTNSYSGINKFSTSTSMGTTTAPSTALTVYGVITSSTPSPTIACSAGTGQMSATATNSAGSFTAGTAATTCTVTFSAVTPWPKAPICIVGQGTSLVTIRVSAVSATSFTAAGTTISNDLLYYICLGAP